MIQYSNQKIYDRTSFDDYLSIDGYSNSFLRNESMGISRKIEPTDKMKLGSIVDSILTEPEKVNMLDPMYDVARDIAAKVKSDFPYVEHFKKQVAMTAIAEYKGFKMTTKGRLDYLFEKKCVLDLKITSYKNPKASIAHFGYCNSMWNYCKMAGVDMAYLIMYCIPLKKTFIEPIDCSQDYNEFWANAILKFGKV